MRFKQINNTTSYTNILTLTILTVLIAESREQDNITARKISIVQDLNKPTKLYKAIKQTTQKYWNINDPSYLW